MKKNMFSFLSSLIGTSLKEENEDSFPFPFDPNGSIPFGVMVIRIGVGAGNISFEPIQKNKEESDLPPLQFTNEKYNIKLRVSHEDYRQEYEEFQGFLKNNPLTRGDDILSSIDKNNTAAISVALDKDAAPNPSDIRMMFMTMMSSGKDVTLINAINLVSDENNNVIFPVCQQLEAFRNQHLFNNTTGELLTASELRDIQDKYQEDLLKQPAVKIGSFTVRNVPGQVI